MPQVNDAPNEDIQAHFERCFDFINSGVQGGGGVVVVRPGPRRVPGPP